MDDPSSQIPYHVIGLIGNLISKIDGPGGPVLYASTFTACERVQLFEVA